MSVAGVRGGVILWGWLVGGSLLFMYRRRGRLAGLMMAGLRPAGGGKWLRSSLYSVMSLPFSYKGNTGATSGVRQ